MSDCENDTLRGRNRKIHILQSGHRLQIRTKEEKYEVFAKEIIKGDPN